MEQQFCDLSLPLWAADCILQVVDMSGRKVIISALWKLGVQNPCQLLSEYQKRHTIHPAPPFTCHSYKSSRHTHFIRDQLNSSNNSFRWNWHTPDYHYEIVQKRKVQFYIKLFSFIFIMCVFLYIIKLMALGIIKLVDFCGGLVTKLCPTLATPWTVACQVPLSMGILQARMLEKVVISFSRGSSQPRNWTQVSCIAARFWNVAELWKMPGFFASGEEEFNPEPVMGLITQSFCVKSFIKTWKR